MKTKIKPGKAIHNSWRLAWNPENGFIKEVDEQRPVTVMAISGKWAMIRRGKCVPYVAELKEIEQEPTKKNAG